MLVESLLLQHLQFIRYMILSRNSKVLRAPGPNQFDYKLYCFIGVFHEFHVNRSVNIYFCYIETFSIQFLKLVFFAYISGTT